MILPCAQATETVSNIQAWSEVRRNFMWEEGIPSEEKNASAWRYRRKCFGTFSYMNSSCLEPLPYDRYLPLVSINPVIIIILGKVMKPEGAEVVPATVGGPSGIVLSSAEPLVMMRTPIGSFRPLFLSVNFSGKIHAIHQRYPGVPLVKKIGLLGGFLVSIFYIS